MKIGYARVSTVEQDLSLQITALEKFGCDVIYSEKKSALLERPELEKLLMTLREGDVLVIWKLDRLGRSLKQLISIVENLNSKGIDLVVVNGLIDTTTAQGKLFYQITGAFAEFERELIVERTRAGLMEAKRRGVKLGRKSGLSEASLRKAKAAIELYKLHSMKTREICISLNISPSTFYKYLSTFSVPLRHDVGRRKKSSL